MAAFDSRGEIPMKQEYKPACSWQAGAWQLAARSTFFND